MQQATCPHICPSETEVQKTMAHIAAVQHHIAAQTTELEHLRAQQVARAGSIATPLTTTDRQAVAKAEAARHIITTLHSDLESVKDRITKSLKVAAQLNFWFVDHAAAFNIQDPHSTPSAFVQKLLQSCRRRADALDVATVHVEGRCNLNNLPLLAEYVPVSVSSAVVAQPVSPSQPEATWEGHLMHPTFGPHRVDVIVWFDSRVRGRWFALGQTQDIEIVRVGEHRFVLQDLVGATTQFDGVHDVHAGTITGEVVRHGVRGGSFVLSLVAPQPLSQRLGPQLLATSTPMPLSASANTQPVIGTCLQTEVTLSPGTTVSSEVLTVASATAERHSEVDPGATTIVSV